MPRPAFPSSRYESTYQQGGKTLPLVETVTCRPEGDYLAREIKGGRACEIDPEGKTEDLLALTRRWRSHHNVTCV